MRGAVIVATLLHLGVTSKGLAQAPGDDILRATSDPKRALLTASTGFAIALGDYGTHGVAFPFRIGADLPRLQTGPVRHHLLLSLEWARFSRMFINEPEVVPGLQLDVASLRGTWLAYPFPRRGLHVDVGVGVSVLHDRLRVALPDRRIASSETTAGLGGAVGLGWTVGRYVDVGLRYAHVVALFGGSSALAQPELVVGVRL
jgi:hypothetical protein